MNEPAPEIIIEVSFLDRSVARHPGCHSASFFVTHEFSPEEAVY
jgi:hypothetical protein